MAPLDIPFPIILALASDDAPRELDVHRALCDTGSSDNLVSADFVKRNGILLEEEDDVRSIKDSRKQSYQVKGYFVGSWKLRGTHAGRPGRFAVVVEPGTLPHNVEVLLRSVENISPQESPVNESNSHMITFHRGIQQFLNNGGRDEGMKEFDRALEAELKATAKAKAKTGSSAAQTEQGSGQSRPKSQTHPSNGQPR